MTTRAQELSYSQSAPVDSLKNAVQATADDTLRLVLLNRVQNYYFVDNTNLDSALLYARQLLLITQKLHYKIDEAYTLDAIALYMKFMFYPQTLETFFKGVRIAEDPGSEKHIMPEKYLRMMLYWTQDFTSVLAKNHWQPQFYRIQILASLYNDLGAAYAHTVYNQPKAFYYLNKAIGIYQSHGALVDLCVAYLDIATYFASVNQFDSCIRYAQKSYDVLIKNENLIVDNRYPFLAVDVSLIGTMYYKKGAVQKAIPLLRQAITLQADEALNAFWLPYYTLAEYYLDRGTIDSSLYYSKKAYAATNPSNRPADLQKASALLAKVYKAAGKPDSAITYYDMALSYNEMINDIEKKRALQTQDFDEQLRQQEQEATRNKVKLYALLGGLCVLLLIAMLLFLNNRRRKKINTLLEQKNQQIEKAYADLKATQAQLIQSEKMASLGELTAGIAHEIQNPLNFINNFSEVNTELIDEMQEALREGGIQQALAVAEEVKTNNAKVAQHGRRADSIVKSMLQHSRTTKSKKQLTDINALADEYLRLSYHGYRAKDKSFNATIETHFDASIEKINLVPQEIGRVLLNLFNNAFYAVHEQLKKLGAGYQPIVSVCTKKVQDKIEIRVQDNGMGISKSIQEKIFQPFFTTKPAGEGTGLGLSLSYDIIKTQGGALNVESTEGDGATFMITLPLA